MLRLDNALNCITNNDKPSAATLRAADPIRVPPISFNPPANTIKEPPNAVRPLAISSHDNPPIDSTTSLIPFIAKAIKFNPKAVIIVLLGTILIPNPIATKAPANPVIPLTN